MWHRVGLLVWLALVSLALYAPVAWGFDTANDSGDQFFQGSALGDETPTAESQSSADGADQVLVVGDDASSTEEQSSAEEDSEPLYQSPEYSPKPRALRLARQPASVYQSGGRSLASKSSHRIAPRPVQKKGTKKTSAEFSLVDSSGRSASQIQSLCISQGSSKPYSIQANRLGVSPSLQMHQASSSAGSAVAALSYYEVPANLPSRVQDALANFLAGELSNVDDSKVKTLFEDRKIVFESTESFDRLQEILTKYSDKPLSQRATRFESSGEQKQTC